MPYQIVSFYPNIEDSNVEIKVCFKSQKSFENFIDKYQCSGEYQQFNYDLWEESNSDQGLPFMSSDDRSWHWLYSKLNTVLVGKPLMKPSLNKPIKGLKIG